MAKPSPQPASRNARLRNFRQYGQMEAANAVVVPLFILWFGWPKSSLATLALGLAILGVIAGLTLGAAYWFALDARLHGRPAPMRQIMPWVARAQRPLLVLVIAAAIALIPLVMTKGWSLAIGVTAGAAALAGLEYVNYYHVQLQHFDNLADLRRLLSGRGLRQSHMARDLARWREESRRAAG